MSVEFHSYIYESYLTLILLNFAIMYFKNLFLFCSYENIYFIILVNTYTIFFFFFRFTQNLSVFRRDVNDSLKGPNILNSTIYDLN